MFSLTTTQLKIIALISMLFDHIWRFIPNSPYIFHWIGRISFPIFIYCTVLGYINTHNKKKYFIRVYVLNVIVGIINFILNINLNAIRTLVILLLIINIIEKIKNNKSWKLLFSFFAWQLITSFLIINLTNYPIPEKILFLLLTITCNILTLDGGIWFILLGIFMYLFNNSTKKITLSFSIITLSLIIIWNSPLLPYIADYLLWNENVNKYYTLFTSTCNTILGIHPLAVTSDLLYGNPQWMMIFSLPLILSYNGIKGKGLKYLFYIFYPIHIIILYVIAFKLI